MEHSIHEILPNQLVEKIVTQHCDIKTIYRFQVTSSAGNTQFMREYPDKIRKSVLQQAFDNTKSYYTFLEGISNDQTSSNVLFKKITKRFADVLMECFLQQAHSRGTGMLVSDRLVGNHIRKVCLQIKERAQINNTQLMKILRAFQRDIPVPTNLQQQSQMCYDFIKSMCFVTPTVWQMLINKQEIFVDFKHNLGCWVIPLEDVDKVKQMMKSDVFNVQLVGDKRPNVAAVHFTITEDNIADLATLIKHMQGNGVFLENNIIRLNVNIYNNTFISKVMNQVFKLHFKSVIKI